MSKFILAILSCVCFSCESSAGGGGNDCNKDDYGSVVHKRHTNTGFSQEKNDDLRISLIEESKSHIDKRKSNNLIPNALSQEEKDLWLKSNNLIPNALSQEEKDLLFSKGMVNFKSYKYENALYYFKLLDNNSKAQYLIGAIYEYGSSPDLKEALYWYKKAQGNDNNEAKKAIERITNKINYYFLPSFVADYVY
jgi:TPR repeat protein